MFCPTITEYSITQHKKDIERARELARSGYCYFEVQNKAGEYFISNIEKMDLGEYLRKKLALSRKKIGRYRAYKTVNSFWAESYNNVKDVHDDDVELDCPTIISINQLFNIER